MHDSLTGRDYMIIRLVLVCIVFIEFPFGLPDVVVVAIFACIGIDYTVCLIFWDRIFHQVLIECRLSIDHDVDLGYCSMVSIDT